MRGGRGRECSDHLSCSLDPRSASLCRPGGGPSSRGVGVCLGEQVAGPASEYSDGRRYLCDRIRYASIAFWNESVLRSPASAVFTPISARQLACGFDTVLVLWWTPQSARNFRVTEAVNSGPPSVVISCDIFWNAEGYEYGSQVPYKASGPVARAFDNGPVGVSVHDDHVSVAFVVCTNALERPCGENRGGSDDCDGDILLQVDRWCEMSAAMPGHASALDSIIVTP